MKNNKSQGQVGGNNKPKYKPASTISKNSDSKLKKKSTSSLKQDNNIKKDEKRLSLQTPNLNQTKIQKIKEQMMKKNTQKQ